MATSPIYLGAPKTAQQQFVAGHATRPRILCTPGSSGCRITQIGIANNDAVANALQIGVAKKLTDAADMGSGAFVDGGGSADSITRSAGSFVDDGWLVGNRLWVYNATTLANDFEAFVQTVAALTLTIPTGTVDTAEAFASATALYRITYLGQIASAAGAGTDGTDPGDSGLDATEMPWLDVSPNRYLQLGDGDILVGKVTTAMGTDEVLDVTTMYQDF